MLSTITLMWMTKLKVLMIKKMMILMKIMFSKIREMKNQLMKKKKLKLQMNSCLNGSRNFITSIMFWKAFINLIKMIAYSMRDIWRCFCIWQSLLNLKVSYNSKIHPSLIHKWFNVLMKWLKLILENFGPSLMKKITDLLICNSFLPSNNFSEKRVLILPQF